MADFDRINRPSRDYWEKRALKLEHLTQQKASDTVKAICRNYDQAQENIVAQIEKIFSRYVNDNETLNEEKALQLLSEKQTAEYRQQLLEQYHSTDDPQLREEIRARLDAPAYANRISRLQALRDQIYTNCRMLGLTEVSLGKDRLMDVLEQSYYRQTFDIQQGVGRYYDFSKLSNRQMQAIIAQPWSGENYSSRIWKNNREFAAQVEHTVASGILSGQSYRDMAENLRRVVGEDDSQGAKYKSMRLIRTECNHVATQGQMLGYQAGGIEEYIFLATLDLVTSKICRSLDMKKFPVSEAQTGVNLPPMHPHCRSTTMPDVDSEVLAKINRAARDPVTGKSNKVPGDMSYSEWYEKYVSGNPEAEANEKKKQNAASDRKQFERYRAVLGEHAPKSLVSFQRMKYNHPEEFESLKLSYKDGKLQKSIRDGKYDLTINPEKQARHMAGSAGYIQGRSYFEAPTETLQKWVREQAGNGLLQRDKNGNWRNTEILTFPEPIGTVLRRDGTRVKTDKAKIHYSKTGVHVVPFEKR